MSEGVTLVLEGALLRNFKYVRLYGDPVLWLPNRQR